MTAKDLFKQNKNSSNTLLLSSVHRVLSVFILVILLLMFSIIASGNSPEPIKSIDRTQSSIPLQFKLDKAIAEKYEKKVKESGPPKRESTAIFQIPATFEVAGAFHKGSAPVQLNGKWGLINTKGEWILAATFADIGTYSKEGLLPVKMDDKYGYIDHLGTPVTEFKFEDAKSFSEGLAAVKVEGLWGYIHPDGKWFISPKFDEALLFKDGAAPVRVATGWGYVFSDNKSSLLPLYQKTYEFSDGYGVVKKNNLLGLINTDGEILIKPSYGWAKTFADGVIAVSTKAGEWKFVDEKGDKVIDGVFQAASSFSEGLVGVKKRGQWGFINKKNEVVIPFEFDRAYDFHEGVAIVVKNGDRFFIDKEGNLLSDAYEDVFRVSEGFAPVKIKDYWGYVFISAESVLGVDQQSDLSEEANQKDVESIQ